jgi:hypothetical protein
MVQQTQQQTQQQQSQMSGASSAQRFLMPVSECEFQLTNILEVPTFKF